MTFNYPLGFLKVSKKTHYLKFLKNTPDLIENHLIVDQMGGGKTNLLTSITYGLFKAFSESKGKEGALPICMMPKFEWYKVNLASRNDNIAPELSPKSMNPSLITFPVCKKPEHIPIPQYSIDFRDLTYEDIGMFANLKSNDSLGDIKKILLEIGEQDIELFVDNLEGKKKLSGLYYVFSELQHKGLFDTERFPVFDWKALIRELKPIIINFGTITDSLFQALGGYLFRKLFELGDYNFNYVILKKDAIFEAKQQGKVTDLKLSEEDKFFLRNPCISVSLHKALAF